MKKTSVFISLILRHKPEVIGINLDAHGWADVQELIAGINATGKYRIDISHTGDRRLDVLPALVDTICQALHEVRHPFLHIGQHTLFRYGKMQVLPDETCYIGNCIDQAAKHIGVAVDEVLH